MSLEIVQEDKSKESSCPPFIDLVNNSVIYFFMGLSFIVAPYAGKRIQEIGSKFLCQKPEKSNLKAITPKINKHNIKNNGILLELLKIMETTTGARYENYHIVNSACAMKNIVEEKSDFDQIKTLTHQYNRAFNTLGSVNWIRTNSSEFFIIPKFTFQNLFGISILHVSFNNQTFSPIETVFKKAVGTYIITDLNITDEIIDELFEIQEKINDLNNDLEKCMNDDSVDEEIVEAVRGSIKIGEEKARSIIETLSKQAQTDKKEKELELYHKALSTNW